MIITKYEKRDGCWRFEIDMGDGIKHHSEFIYPNKKQAESTAQEILHMVRNGKTKREIKIIGDEID